MKRYILPFAALMALSLYACGDGSQANQPGGPAAATGVPAVLAVPTITSAPAPQGGELCQLLTAGDFASVGLTDAADPTITSDDPNSAKCLYAGDSGTTGGLELDVYVHDDATAARETFKTVSGQIPSGRPQNPVGADGALTNDKVADTYGATAVRVGRLVFIVLVPTSADTHDQLSDLVHLVLDRTKTFK